MKIRTGTRTMIACTAAASAALLLTGSSAGAAGGAATASSGVVGDLLGAALARFPAFGALAGAQVLLAAWPSNDTLHALPVGGTFSITPVARTVTGSDGTYELRSALTPLLASLTSNDGLDVELDVFHGGRHHVYLTQVVPDRSIGGWVYELGARNTLDVALDPRISQELSRDLLQVPVRLPGDPRPPAAPGCSNRRPAGQDLRGGVRLHAHPSGQPRRQRAERVQQGGQDHLHLPRTTAGILVR